MLYSRKPRAASALLSLGVIFFTGLLSAVQATLQCAQPNNGTYSAGDSLILNWSSDGSSPTVQDIKSMTATLNCNNGISIANVTITSWATPYTWTVPSVGNATTAGGTTGTCPSNSFHVEYAGVASVTVLGFITQEKAFTISCETITILPAANNTITTTAPATTTTVATTKSKTSSSTSTSSSSASPTPSNDANGDDSKPKTFIIVIVAIVAGLILFLVAFATWWYLRNQRIKRMEDAIMPWSNQPGNQFSKVSSMDEGHRTLGSVNGAPAVSNKPQPMPPQPQKSYYNGDEYGSQYGLGGGYDNYNNGNNRDEYYDPYYAANRAGYGASPPNSNTTYYNNSTPYLDPRDPYQQPAPTGYFPPPPPVVPSLAPSPMPSTVSQLNTVSDVAPSSGSLRAPQVILPEKGSSSTEDDIQMKVLVKSSE